MMMLKTRFYFFLLGIGIWEQSMLFFFVTDALEWMIIVGICQIYCLGMIVHRYRLSRSRTGYRWRDYL